MLNLHRLLENHAGDIFHRLNESREKKIYNISIPHLALILLFQEKPFIVIEDSHESAFALYRDMMFFRDFSVPAFHFFYFPPPVSPEFIGERARTLLNVAAQSNACLITSVEAYKTGFTISTLRDSVLKIEKGISIDRSRLNELLVKLGYRKVNIVVDKGEYAERNWLFDIYPVTEDYPVRAEFFGDEIDLIRTFDIETQRSIREIEELVIYPAEEFSVRSLELRVKSPEAESINKETGILDMELESNILSDILQFQDSDVYVNSETGLQNSELLTLNSQLITFSHLPFVSSGINSGELSIKGLGIMPEERRTLKDIADRLAAANRKVICVLSSTAQAERFKEILFDGGVIAPVIERQNISLYDGNICITTGMLSSGINLDPVLILTDREIFGERLSYRPIKKSKVSRLLFSIDDLTSGDFVVHKDHGIGKFIGLRRQKTEDYEEDLITLEYANGDRLHIPFQSIDRLQKYSAGEGNIPVMDRLGGKRWIAAKKRVKKGIKEMAEKLLSLYAERKVSRGFVFSEDTPMHREFDDFFPYEETADQIKTIEEIKKHMNSEMPMDMLLCGDVGYGKTEVAMKAAFRAVYDGKQVAVLVPTTLLAEQHFRTFKTRFSGFPVNIDYLSRFKSIEGIKKCIKSIEHGEVDIIIGTHMLLNKKVQFHDIGLLIIDEEHRFGVAQKERLKELKQGVDVLTLTATPIPRTLHMSISGIREMCIIETPPEERLAVRSVVTVFDDRTIREAIEKELKRGGQTFFLHNRVKDIDRISAYIKKLIPSARIAVAHGQMKERELESIMLDFLDRKIDVLICTAIIGSGLDIPTANTIIVNRADAFGLSDLYQLRGRVGRGDTQAYSYFLIPGGEIITDEAKKRLQAIQEMSYLGAGFRLALKDLEIRGAGNLLGAEQSGHIYRVGFDMYMEMMEKAVAELKGEEIKEEVEPQIKLRLSAFIPEDYIPDITLRLSIYKRLSSVKSLNELSELKEEIIDRFGNLPEEANNLIYVVSIKIMARHLFISKVYDIDGRYRFLIEPAEFSKYSLQHLSGEFFDRLLRILFELQSGRKNGISMRFLQNGFEIDTRGMSSHDAIEEIEGILLTIAERLKIF
jgi:transcription-repair coupling factor (superfamily II helicase)